MVATGNNWMGLHWEASYEIVLALMQRYPDADIETLGLNQLYQMIVSLPDFDDDSAMVTDHYLKDILGEWYEEVNS
jgi:FeS assembly protein IscX